MDDEANGMKKQAIKKTNDSMLQEAKKIFAGKRAPFSDQRCRPIPPDDDTVVLTWGPAVDRQELELKSCERVRPQYEYELVSADFTFYSLTVLEFFSSPVETLPVGVQEACVIFSMPACEGMKFIAEAFGKECAYVPNSGMFNAALDFSGPLAKTIDNGEILFHHVQFIEHMHGSSLIVAERGYQAIEKMEQALEIIRDDPHITTSCAELDREMISIRSVYVVPVLEQLLEDRIVRKGMDLIADRTDRQVLDAIEWRREVK